MTDVRQRNWASHGYYVFFALFMAGMLLSIADERGERRLEERDSISGSPRNLAWAPESFWLKLRAESPDVTVEDMMKTQAWRDLKKTTSAYARRLEFMERQRFRLGLGVLAATLAAVIGMFVMNSKERQKGRNADPEIA